MKTLTFADKAFRAYARYVERPTLALVGRQSLLRGIFAMTSPLTFRVPKSTKVQTLADKTRHITPPGVADDAPILLYLHGGGFTIGSPRTHTGLAAHLAQAAGCRAVVPAYRLAPEAPFPAAKQDCIAAFDALLRAGTPPVAICGDSAGGCLALQVAIHARDTMQTLPKALGLIAPVADLSGDISSRFAQARDEILIPPSWARRIATAYLRVANPTDPAVSPLLADLSGLPPTLIQAGVGEALAQDGKRLVDAMDDATLDLWPGLPHVWHLHAGLAPAANKALAQMGAFLDQAIAKAP